MKPYNDEMEAYFRSMDVQEAFIESTFLSTTYNEFCKKEVEELQFDMSWGEFVAYTNRCQMRSNIEDINRERRRQQEELEYNKMRG